MTVKIDGDTIQDVITLNRNASMLFFIATNGLVVFPDFDSLDESFSHHKELVTKTTQPSCLQFNRQFEHIDKLLSNQLVKSAIDENIVGKLTVQTKEEMQDMMKSDNVIEIVELILKNLVPKFGNNKLKYYPHQIISELNIQNNGSFNKSHA